MAQRSCGRSGRADVAERSSLGPANELCPRWLDTQAHHLVGFSAATEDQVDLSISQGDRYKLNAPRQFIRGEEHVADEE